MTINHLIVLSALLVTGCTAETATRSRQGSQESSKFSGSKKNSTTTKQASINEDEKSNGSKGRENREENGTKEKAPPSTPLDIDEKPLKKAKKETRSHRAIICQEGLKVANRAERDDFSNIFRAICNKGVPSADFEEVVGKAYNGTGEPFVKLIRSSTDEMFVSELLFAYALEVPLQSASQFADINVYAKLSQNGINDETSQLGMSILSRADFPGKGSVEKVRLKQELQLANGAALFDTRITEINNYLLVEATRDVTLSTEHLVNGEGNEYWHIARGILVGLDGPTANSTNLVYVTELVAKNRIDPDRLRNTVLDLAKATTRLIYQATIDAQP